MVKSYIVGDSNIFAIEFNIHASLSHHVMGQIRLWFNDLYLGDFEDINILGVTLYQLERLSKMNDNGDSFEDISEEDVYNLIHSEDNLDGNGCYFSPGESFDDFSIVVYNHDGVLKFIWKLLETPFYKYSDYPKGIKFAKVSVEYFSQTVAEFKKVIMDKS